MDQSFESTISQASREHPPTALVRSIAATRYPQGTKHSTGKLARFLITFKDTVKEAIQIFWNLQDVNVVSLTMSEIT